MDLLRGTGVSSGIAIGPLHVFHRRQYSLDSAGPVDASAELKSYHEASVRAAEQLADISAAVRRDVGEDEASILEIHQMMLQDQDFVEYVSSGICEKGRNARQAVADAVEHFSALFVQTGDEYMSARAIDVRDVGQRLIGILEGDTGEGAMPGVPVIIAADDLTPSETVRLEPARVLAFVTTHGSASSHTAILARTRGIPAVIGVERAFTARDENSMVIIDGDSGEVWIEPDVETLEKARAERGAQRARQAELMALKGCDSVSLSGKKVEICANIGRPQEADAALENDAEGIGLFRSEFLYLEKDTYPTEEELFRAYKSVVQRMEGKRVIIRTLDIGADKQAAYFGIEKEENPALGYRAVRICLDRPEIFRTQLRAIYRASAFGQASIMVPMIISADEVRRVRHMALAAREELVAEGVAVGSPVELGIMVETPAAALISDRLAAMVDFFSIGTNDLTQYTLALDRQNPRLEEYFDPHHAAVLRLIKMIVDNAHDHGIWVGICGELAGDLTLTQTFLDMGVDELSVSPSLVLPLRQRVRQCV